MRLICSKACGVRGKAVKQMLNKRMNTAKQEETYTNVAESLIQARHYPICTDDISHTLLDVVGIESSGLL